MLAGIQLKAILRMIRSTNVYQDPQEVRLRNQTLLPPVEPPQESQLTCPFKKMAMSLLAWNCFLTCEYLDVGIEKNQNLTHR